LRPRCISFFALISASVHRQAMVHFIGGGPGAPDLLTIRAAEVIATADALAGGSAPTDRSEVPSVEH